MRASGTGIKNKYLFILTQGIAEIQVNFGVTSTSIQVACISWPMSCHSGCIAMSLLF